MMLAVERFSLGSTPRLERPVELPSWTEVAGGPRLTTLSREDRAAKSFVSVGVAALMLLPAFMLASFIAHAPLAGPAVLALGYLAVGRAPLARVGYAASAVLIVVLVSLVLWTLIVALWAEKPLGLSGLAAAALAPAFAAAPALVNRIGALSKGPIAAGEVVTWLDRLAPDEMVLIIDATGAVLAGTRAGLSLFNMSPAEVGASIGQNLSPSERVALLESLASAGCGSDPVDVRLPSLTNGVGSHGITPLQILPAGPGLFALRVPAERPEKPTDLQRENEAGLPAPIPPRADEHRIRRYHCHPGECCNLREAVGFALERLRPILSQRSLTVQLGSGPALSAACDRQSARRIVITLVECALRSSDTAAPLELSVRAVKTTGLIRVAAARARDHNVGDRNTELQSFHEAVKQTDLTSVVDACGGTLVIEAADAASVASVRLGLAAEGRQPDLRGAA
jgi:hypothetical protein